MLANETGDHRAFAVQVPWTQYFTPRYCSPKRLASYGHQLQEVSRLKPESVLEIGIGNGIVAGLMKSCGYAVTTLDHDASLGPDVVASVTSVPLEDDVVDVVLCCEVLEHLPYEQVSMALSEIRRVSSKFAVLSVPDRGRYCRVDVKLPFLKSLRVCMECPPWNAPVLRPGSEHY